MKRLKRYIHNKNTVIIILCITIIAMSFGYVFLSMKLEEYKNEKHTFDVDFLSARKIAAIKGGVYEPVGNLEVDKTGKILNMDFELFMEHDEIDFEVTIKNNGTSTASIVKLLSSLDMDEDSSHSSIVLHISDISGKILESGEETTFKLSAIYQNRDDSSDVFSHHLTGRLGIIAESFES